MALQIRLCSSIRKLCCCVSHRDAAGGGDLYARREIGERSLYGKSCVPTYQSPEARNFQECERRFL